MNSITYVIMDETDDVLELTSVRPASINPKPQRPANVTIDIKIIGSVMENGEIPTIKDNPRYITLTIPVEKRFFF